ncbi:uncharacterized protein LOC117642974 [Thrips palmi]|uniref:Uncharacterized protein LOC117642974 n=1 Tax=Thrips palmi TaxID=161013 RepID=A0A6P8YKE2_THRPL|nr:uncharacterized protein LOC117642974 [Thrips palmi]
MYAAIWPLTALRKEDFMIVPSTQIKKFQPQHDKDFGAKTVYKYKPPSAPKSTQVFILALAESEAALKIKMMESRIHYPNRKSINPASSTTEEDANSEAALAKAKKGEGEKRNASQILNKYKTKLFSNTSTEDLSKAKRINLQGSSLQEGRLPVKSSGSKTSNIPVKIVVKKPLLQGSGVGGDTQPPAEDSVVTPEGTSSQNTPPVLSSSSVSEFVNLQKEMKLLQQKNVILEKKLQQISNERLEASQSELEIVKSNIKETLDQELLKIKDQIRDTFNAERQELEKSLQARLENIPGPSKPRIIHKIINTRKLDKDPTEGHLPSVELVNIGHGVQADNDIWSTIEGNTSKDDWAYSALLAVFGEQAKFYRVRKPRSKDADLRQFPSKPPVLFVLQHYYKSWLKKNPCVLDEKPKMKKNEAPIADEEWVQFLEDETQADREKRRAVTLPAMVKQLGGLLGDKAINMYRASKGRTRGASGEDSSGDSSSSESDHDQSDSNHQDDKTDQNDENDSSSSSSTN